MDGDEVLSEVHLYVQRHKLGVHRTEFAVSLPEPELDCLHTGAPDDDEDIEGRPIKKRFVVYHTLATKLSDVGCQVWPASLLLADWIVHKRKLSGQGDHIKTVLELGAGIGLPSLVAAACGADVLLSDSCLVALDLAHKASQINAAWINHRGGTVKVCHLDWRHGADMLNRYSQSRQEQGLATCDNTNAAPNTSNLVTRFQMTECEWLQALQAQVVLAADVLYDDDMTDHLCRFLRAYLHARSPRSSAAGPARASNTHQQDTGGQEPTHPDALPAQCLVRPTVILAAEKRYIFTKDDARVCAPAFERFLSHVRLVAEGCFTAAAHTRSHAGEGVPRSAQHSCMGRMHEQPMQLLGRFLPVSEIERSVEGVQRSSDLTLMEIWLADQLPK